MGGVKHAFALVFLRDWHPVLRDPLDVFRLSFPIGAFVYALLGDWDTAVRLAAPGVAVFLVRAIDVPRPVDWVFSAAMFFQGWGNALHLFSRFWWYDKQPPALFPATLLAAAGGLAFGTVEGAALAWPGAVLGGLVAFAAARTLARAPAQRLVKRVPALGRVHALLERRAFAAVRARLMPGVPATGLHYAAGRLAGPSARVRGGDRHRRAVAHHAVRVPR